MLLKSSAPAPRGLLHGLCHVSEQAGVYDVPKKRTRARRRENCRKATVCKLSASRGLLLRGGAPARLLQKHLHIAKGSGHLLQHLLG